MSEFVYLLLSIVLYIVAVHKNNLPVIMKKVIYTLVLAILISSCTKNYEEINTDPNTIQTTPSTNILAGTIKSLTVITQFDLGYEMTALWSQSLTQTTYADFDRYVIDQADFDYGWRDSYALLANLNQLIKQAGEEENYAMEGVALILRAYIGQVIADLWGKAPWSEGGRGFDETPIFSPKYDDAINIYQSIIKDLESAITKLSQNSNELGNGDLFYAGDLSKWQKFGNSLLLRVLNRVSGTSIANDARMNALISKNNLIQTNDENASLSFDKDLSASINPIYNALESRKDIVCSKLFVDLLLARDEDNGGRLIAFAERKDLQYRGLQNGGYDVVTDSISDIAFSYQDNPSSPLHLLTYPEVEFIKAEYYNRSGDAVNSQTAYESGITASFDMYELTVPANYLTHPLVQISGSYPIDQAIAEQKYIALWLQGVEAYSEQRRTGFPTLTIGPLMFSPTTPTKFPYPNSEVELNTQNVPNTSLDEKDNKVFWDQ